MRDLRPTKTEDGVLPLILTVLALLDGEIIVPDLPENLSFWRIVNYSAHSLATRYDTEIQDVAAVMTQYRGPEWGEELPVLVALLSALGVAAGDTANPQITDLGRWARGRLAAGLPVPADPTLSAADMVAEAARFPDDKRRRHVAYGWLKDKDPVVAVREILTAATTMNSAERSVAIHIAKTVSDRGLPAWREMRSAPCVGPHALMMLWDWEELDDVPDADVHWLAVEEAAIAVAEDDPDEALTILLECLPGDGADACLEIARATGHPEADMVLKAVAQFAASGAPRSVDTVLQLKVSLTGYRPAVWRSVRVPAVATLENLHYVIGTLFGWDGDHLHEFTVGKESYSGEFGHLEETGYDNEIRLGAAFAGVKRIDYVYDLGTYWEHEITLEKKLPFDRGQRYPVCVGFRGDSPVEYPDSDYANDLGPFDIDAVNRRLSGDLS